MKSKIVSNNPPPKKALYSFAAASPSFSILLRRVEAEIPSPSAIASRCMEATGIPRSVMQEKFLAADRANSHNPAQEKESHHYSSRAISSSTAH